MLADLLIDAAATKLATSLVNSSRGNLVAEVNALGYNLSLSEGNSVACSGAPGVSNTMASNLWVVDELFNSAQAGLSNCQWQQLQQRVGSSVSAQKRADAIARLVCARCCVCRDLPRTRRLTSHAASAVTLLALTSTDVVLCLPLPVRRATT